MLPEIGVFRTPVLHRILFLPRRIWFYHWWMCKFVEHGTIVFVLGTYFFVKGRFTTCTFIAPVLLATLVLYLLILIPGLGARHLAFGWPFIAAAHAIVLVRIWPRVSVPGLAVLALIVAPAESYVAYLKYKAESNPAPMLPALIREAKHIVITNIAMGILPRYLSVASDDALVFASPALRRGLPDLPPGAIIIVNPQYFVPNVAVQTESIASDIGEKIYKSWTTKVFQMPSQDKRVPYKRNSGECRRCQGECQTEAATGN